MQKSKMAVWGGLPKAVKRREVKSKGEKERYKHLNAQFQRTARRDKKAFFSDQCKENRGKEQNGKDQRSLQENQRHQGNIHAKMGSIKDRNGTDLTEAEDIERWQEYTEELYKYGLKTPQNHEGVALTYSQTSWSAKSSGPQKALLQTKASGSDGIPAELFQILKDDAIKVLHSICQNIWKTQQRPRAEKGQFYSNPKDRQCQRILKIPHNFTHLTYQ